MERFLRAGAAGDFLDQAIEYRRQDQAEEGDAQHAREHRGAHGLAHFRTRTRGQHQRHDTQNKGEGRHQDRTQTQAACLDHRLNHGFAVFLPMAREFDDQDRVLGGKADQHHEADLGKDVVIHPAQVDADQRGQHRHRHDQDDRHGQGPAFVFRRKHQKHEDNGQREDIQGGIPGLDLLEGQFRPFPADTGGQVFGQFLHLMEGVARAVARRGVARHRDGDRLVVTLDQARAGGFGHADQRAQRHGLARVVTGFQAGYVFGPDAVILLRLRDHLIHMAKGVEVVDVGRAEIDLQRAEYVGKRDAQHLRLDPVDVQMHLRRAGGEGGVNGFQPRRLVGLSDQAVCRRHQGGQTDAALVLDHHLVAAGGADAAHGRGRNDDDEGILDRAKALLQVADDRAHGLRRAGL